LDVIDINDVIKGPMINKSENLKNIWLRNINILGRRYIGGWVRGGVNRLDISFHELEAFLYLIQLSGHCDFAKRDIIYNNLIKQVPESSRSLLMDRKRFHLLIIMWHYLNQEYFRRSDKDAYHQLGPSYKIKRTKILRRFEGYYKLSSKVKTCIFS
jgi:hypothetical protein